VKWGLDTDESVFQAFGVPYQPASVMIASDGTIVDSWAGARGEAELREAIETLITS
jgi:thioredoxin-like negative regulator of GroEL